MRLCRNLPCSPRASRDLQRRMLNTFLRLCAGGAPKGGIMQLCGSGGRGRAPIEGVPGETLPQDARRVRIEILK